MKNLKDQPCVYILSCCDDSLYTGWTNDLDQRVKNHQAGRGGKYTRSRLPVELVYVEMVEDRSAALKREAAIKKLKPAAKRALLSSSLNLLNRVTTS